MKITSNQLYAGALLIACASFQSLSANVFNFDGAALVYDSHRAESDSSGIYIFDQYAEKNPMVTIGFDWSNSYSYGSWYYAWNGINISNCSNTSVDVSQYWAAGEKAQYTSVTGTDASGVAGGMYGVFFGVQEGNPYGTPPVPGSPYSKSENCGTITFSELVNVDSISVANNLVTYDYLTKNLNDNDEYYVQQVQIYGITASGDYTENYVTATLSDASGVSNKWIEVDLNALNTADGLYGLYFQLYSSDYGDFGANTPAYFCMDNLNYTVIPEPANIATLIALLTIAATFAIRRNRAK